MLATRMLLMMMMVVMMLMSIMLTMVMGFVPGTSSAAHVPVCSYLSLREPSDPTCLHHILRVPVIQSRLGPTETHIYNGFCREWAWRPSATI